MDAGTAPPTLATPRQRLARDERTVRRRSVTRDDGRAGSVRTRVKARSSGLRQPGAEENAQRELHEDRRAGGSLRRPVGGAIAGKLAACPQVDGKGDSSALDAAREGVLTECVLDRHGAVV